MKAYNKKKIHVQEKIERKCQEKQTIAEPELTRAALRC